jgi:chorismate mutase
VDRVEALKILRDSREEIDKLDEEIIKLIKMRTSLAVKIAWAKKALDLEVEDKEREEYIQHKIRELAREQEINESSLTQIIKILTDMSKEEQQKILRR